MRIELRGREIDDIGDICDAKAADRTALAAVTELDLADNCIASCLRPIGRADVGGASSSSSLAPLSALSVLCLARNKLSSLRGIGAVRTLTSLDVSGNRLSSLVGIEDCALLSHLDARRCGLHSLEGLPRVQGPTTVTLLLSHNKLRDGALRHINSSVAIALFCIDVSWNAFDHWDSFNVLKSKSRFPRLQKVDLSHNPFLVNGSYGSAPEGALELPAVHVDLSFSDAGGVFRGPPPARVETALRQPADMSEVTGLFLQRSRDCEAVDGEVVIEERLLREIGGRSMSISSLADPSVHKLKQHLKQKNQLIRDMNTTIRSQKSDIEGLKNEVAALQDQLRRKGSELECLRVRVSATEGQTHRMSALFESQPIQQLTRRTHSAHQKVHFRTPRNDSFVDNFGNRGSDAKIPRPHRPRDGDYPHAHHSYTYPEDLAPDNVSCALSAKHNLRHENTSESLIPSWPTVSVRQRAAAPAHEPTDPDRSESQHIELIAQQTTYIDAICEENRRLMRLLSEVASSDNHHSPTPKARSQTRSPSSADSEVTLQELARRHASRQMALKHYAEDF